MKVLAMVLWDRDLSGQNSDLAASKETSFDKEVDSMMESVRLSGRNSETSAL